MTAHVRRNRPRAEAGFVLVGVVMFVLALTILGISLFSLSSFEAQFLGRSVHQAQAFDHAAGGLERCKFVLAQTSDLGAVGAGISEATPREGIVYASAAQDTTGDGIADDSTGTVQWTPDSPITITVRARERDIVRTLQATFRPTVARNPYKYLLSAYRSDISGVIIGVTGPDEPANSRVNTVNLDGRVWQNSHDTGYVPFLEAPPSGGVKLDSLPAINVPQFIADHMGSALPAVYDAATSTWQVHATGIGYFATTSADPVTGDFSLRSLGEVKISVRDTAVWMLPKGIRIDGLVTVKAANPGACLIILSNRNGSFVDAYGNWEDVATWFFGGLNSTSVPIVLATSNQIRLEQVYNFDKSTEIAYLSMYAGYVRMMGPRTVTGYRMRVHHAPDYGADYLIDRLVAQGVLPGSEFLSPSKFNLVAGSWQEVRP